MKDYKKILEGVVNIINTTEKSDVGFDNIRAYIGENCPELKEREDEKVEKAIFAMVYDSDNELWSSYGVSKGDVLAWLEKQSKEEYALKSFKDEDVRKFVQCIEKQAKAYEFNLPNRGYDIYAFAKDLLVWLEKQGEQKSADKIKPKFHEGEWLCENEPNNYARFIQILETVNVQGKERYRISRDIHNDEDIVEFDFVEKYYHKFDIKDAKDGDVLVNGSNIFIFHFINDTRLMGYCHVNTDDGRFYDDIGKNECFCLIDAVVNPATKEQRDLLFRKVK